MQLVTPVTAGRTALLKSEGVLMRLKTLVLASVILMGVIMTVTAYAGENEGGGTRADRR